jgi:murein DD-endopeptidase MepM/ murein hydrolase activator NlpD
VTTRSRAAFTGANAAAGIFMLVVTLAFVGAAFRGRGREWLASKFLNRGALPSPLDPVAASRSIGVAIGGSGLLAGVWADPVPGARGPIGAGVFGAPRRRADGSIDPHDGIDLLASMGTPVYAARSGDVKIASYPGSGLCGGRIELDHGAGVTSLYCHLSAVAVTSGRAVTRGSLVGRVGGPGDAGAGNAAAEHLHFEVRRNGVPIDPTALVGR